MFVPLKRSEMSWQVLSVLMRKVSFEGHGAFVTERDDKHEIASASVGESRREFANMKRTDIASNSHGSISNAISGNGLFGEQEEESNVRKKRYKIGNEIFKNILRVIVYKIWKIYIIYIIYDILHWKEMSRDKC